MSRHRGQACSFRSGSGHAGGARLGCDQPVGNWRGLSSYPSVLYSEGFRLDEWGLGKEWEGLSVRSFQGDDTPGQKDRERGGSS